MRPLVWLWDSEAYARSLLTELLEEAFTVCHCCGLSTVWRDLLVGQAGVLVADFTRVTSLGLPDQTRLRYLSALTPVLLLVDEPALVHLAQTDLGVCNVLFRPFDDLDRLLAAVVELSRHTPTAGTLMMSSF